MLYKGPRLQAAIPDNVTIWSWLFDSSQGLERSGGFRDAFNDQFFSYDHVRQLATRLSAVLHHKYGLRAGDGVCIFASNTIWYPVALFAAVRLGVVATASSPEYGAEEAAYILQSSKAKLIFADHSSYKALTGAAAILGLDENKIIFLEPPRRQVHLVDDLPSVQAELESADAARAVPAFGLPPGKTGGQVCAFLSFTSGTTSRPKGVMISHRNVIAQIMQMKSLGREDLPRVLLGVLPLFHITGLVQILHLPIVLDQQVIIMPKFDMKGMMETIVKHQCDELWLVPPLLIRLVNDPLAAGYNLSTVKQFNTGAAPLAREIIDKAAKRFPHVAIRQAWGMTESTSALTLTPPVLQTYENAHTVGAVVPDTVLKIVDPETGEQVEQGGSGEIWAKGPQVTMGYLDTKQATADTFDQEGYLHTGDIGTMLSNGLLLVQDRLKEMIKVKGVGVAPAELEDHLLGHPAVIDVAVIGISDAYSGEIPKAFVVLDKSVEPGPQTAQVLQDFVRKTKSRSKWLVGGVEFLDQIPKSASGKILRRVLRHQEDTCLKPAVARPRL